MKYGIANTVNEMARSCKVDGRERIEGREVKSREVRSPEVNGEEGFTLIELLTIIGIIGVLASLALTSFGYYKASAALAVAETTIHDARGAFEGGIVDADNLPASVPLTSQNSQGNLSSPLASALLPGFKVPSNVRFRVSYDNTCITGACQVALLETRHCQGEEYVRWVRFGDGVETKLQISGTGCS
ncbi:MAG: hypothetical protein KDD60_11670 [Bdellovibrionales bacterium]|nr:hypothetical protein [Bdellovibrionales bacterium]